VIYPHPYDPRLRRRQDQPDHQHAREHPRTKREQPPTRPRSILDSGLSRRNTVLRYQPANMSLTTRRATRQARRPLSRATTAHRRKPIGPGLTPLPPYEFRCARRSLASSIVGRWPAVTHQSTRYVSSFSNYRLRSRMTELWPLVRTNARATVYRLPQRHVDDHRLVPVGADRGRVAVLVAAAR